MKRNAANKPDAQHDRAVAGGDLARRARRPVLRFVVLFALGMAVFYAVTLAPAFQNGPFQTYLHANAAVSAWILDLLGEGARSTGFTVTTSRFSLSIQRGCDAIEPSALFVAALIAFPAPLSRKLWGLMIGVPSLLLINFVRIVSLYYTGVHFPDAFDIMHVEVWQPLFILLAMAAWIAWALWATRPRAAGSET